MWNKSYAAVLGISIILSAAFTYYAYSWLQSISAPASVVQNYEHYSHINWIFLCASSIVLLVLANIILWTTRKAWAMWATLLYFAVFILVQTLWLENLFFSYKQQNNLTDSPFSLGAFSGILLTVAAAVIVYFDQFIVKRMSDKMFRSNEANLQTDDVSENQS